MPKKLTQQIEKKLDKLNNLLDKIDEARIIQPTEPETWDADLLYNLKASCQAVINLLEDKKHPHDKDPWGDPIISEEGLYSLVDDYQSEIEEEEND